MQYPLVSAIVLCYNHARFVIECLESVKAQNYPNLELIVNDDASRDDSAVVIQAWLSKNNIPHRFVRQETNQGICRSANQTMSLARGKYISGIAADDVWLPGKLLTQVELMERLPEKYGVVYSDALQMDEEGKILERKFIEVHRHFEVKPEGNIHTILWEGNFIPAMTTLVRKACTDKVGGYDESLYVEDWDMWLRISRFFEFAYSDKISAKYRLVSTSMVRSNLGTVLDAMCQVCLKHLKGGSLEGEARRAAVSQLQSKAMLGFQCRSPGHKRNLLHALRYRASVGTAAGCIFAWCGFRYGRYERARAIFRGRRST
jgi:glycosyltransferase involved in cell wall biosynthesis